MALHIAIPIAAAVVLGGGAVALRLNALKKKDVPSPPSPPPAGPKVAPTAPAVAAQLPALITNPDGTPHTQGTPFNFSTGDAAQAAVDEANARGISVQQLLLEKSGQLAKSGDGVAALGQKAIVTTSDPAPAGDLIVRSSASQSAGQIGGAEKGGTVIVLDSSDPIFARIQWAGGSRWPAVTGFAKKQFLKLV